MKRPAKKTVDCEEGHYYAADFCADERFRADGVVLAVSNFCADDWVVLAVFGVGMCLCVPLDR